MLPVFTAAMPKLTLLPDPQRLCHSSASFCISSRTVTNAPAVIAALVPNVEELIIHLLEPEA